MINNKRSKNFDEKPHRRFVIPQTQRRINSSDLIHFTWFLRLIRVSSPKRYLDRFSHFRRAHKRDQQTDRQTDRPWHSVYSKRLLSLQVTLRWGLIIIIIIIIITSTPSSETAIIFTHADPTSIRRAIFHERRTCSVTFTSAHLYGIRIL